MPATLLAWVDEASVALQGAADAIANSLRAAPLVHADDSGLRVQGKLHWLHVAANDSHTLYGVHAKRGMEAIATQAIVPQRFGVLFHDCWAPYWQLPGTHALCNTYFLRELLYVQELTGERMFKVKQKISGSFSTLLGAKNFCVIRSCLDTLRKQGHGMLAVLQRAFAGNPIQPAPG